MSTPPTKAYLLARLQELQQQIDEYPIYGSDSDYVVDDIFTWRQTFGPGSRRRNDYTFVAIKRGPDHWQLSSGHRVSWNDLISDYFPEATTDVVRATQFEAI